MVNAEQALHRLAHHEQPLSLAAAAAAVSAARTATPDAPSPDYMLAALTLVRWMQTELTVIEPALIAAARAAGASWQDLAPALGVASRQAAERRYLRRIPTTAGQPTTQDGRVRAERDRRAGTRAINRWANANTADLRRLAGQITALTNLGPDAADDIDRLHQALADPDATALPALLAETRRHLHAHTHLADQIDAIDTHSQQVRHDTDQLRNPSPTTTRDSRPPSKTGT